MVCSLVRFLYRCLVRLHPPSFQKRFAPEMLWIFDEAVNRQGALPLFADGFTSLARQWVVRWAIQKLLIGEFNLSPVSSLGAGQFTWERIEFADPPLPFPRMIQGGLLSFAFLTCICVVALHTGTVSTARRMSGITPNSGRSQFSNTGSPAGAVHPTGTDRKNSPLVAVAANNRDQQSGSAQPLATANTSIPDTTSARHFAAWLDAFNTGDKTVLLQFLTKDFPSHVGEIDAEANFRNQTGGFDLVKTEEATPTQFSGIVKERDSDQFARFVMEIEPREPHRIVRLDLRAIARPPEFPMPRLTESEALTALRAKLEQAAAADRFSGTALIAKNGKPIFTAAYGLADRDKKIPITLATRFRIGSMNKMFTAVSVLQLAQAGKLQLSDPLGKYLTDYPNKDLASQVTVEQALTHTGGTGDFFGPEFDAHRLELRTLQDYVKLYGKRAPEFEPGSRWSYSNYGFLLLGLVVEKASGEDYYQYVREHVYRPAGMSSSDSLPENETVPGRSLGYTRLGGGALWRNNSDTLPFRGTSAGGGYSTVGDLLAFANAIQNHKLLDAHYTMLLTTGKVDTPNGEKYAYGFMDRTEGGVRTFGHGGGAPGMNGDLRICPTSGYVVVVLANLDPPAAQHIADFAGNRLPE